METSPAVTDLTDSCDCLVQVWLGQVHAALHHKVRGKSDTVSVSVVRSGCKVCEVIACIVRFMACVVTYHTLSCDLQLRP